MNKHMQEMHRLEKVTSAAIAKWPKWKRDYHEYKKSLRHAKNGNTVQIKAAK